MLLQNTPHLRDLILSYRPLELLLDIRPPIIDLPIIPPEARPPASLVCIQQQPDLFKTPIPGHRLQTFPERIQSIGRIMRTLRQKIPHQFGMSLPYCKMDRRRIIILCIKQPATFRPKPPDHPQIFMISSKQHLPDLRGRRCHPIPNVHGQMQF